MQVSLLDHCRHSPSKMNPLCPFLLSLSNGRQNLRLTPVRSSARFDMVAGVFMQICWCLQFSWLVIGSSWISGVVYVCLNHSY
jgi:hypothetical protein